MKLVGVWGLGIRIDTHSLLNTLSHTHIHSLCFYMVHTTMWWDTHTHTLFLSILSHTRILSYAHVGMFTCSSHIGYAGGS